MKKLLFAVAFLMIFSACAFAEPYDLSSMTEVELVELQAAVQEELYSRDEIQDFALYPGEYIVGTDIEPGVYVINMVVSAATEAEPTASISVYSSKESYDNYEDYVGFELLSSDYNKVRMTLTDGQYVKVKFNVCTAVKLR